MCSSGDVIAFEGPNATSGLFATYPQPYLTTFGGIVDQFTGTAVLMASIFAMIDEKNGLAPSAGKRKSKEIYEYLQYGGRKREGVFWAAVLRMSTSYVVLIAHALTWKQLDTDACCMDACTCNVLRAPSVVLPW